ncbi:MAG: cytochrome c oxidase subunit 3 [Candidatus Solibacter usitatus]|nr:cytochrome c oxidase subunit 3 [Candidatus Solibacter usitatus]
MNVAAAGARRRASFTGLYAFFATMIMFFGAFTSAMVVRRGASKDWQGVPTPNLLWINTGVLALSSVVAERARRDLQNGNRRLFNTLWAAATVLGACFVAGQIIVWRDLQQAGVYINSHSGGAFFYVGTVAHAAHLAGGWIAMVYLLVRAFSLQLGPGRRTAVDITTLYWHFLGVLWLYLLWLFWFWGNWE